MKYNEPRRQCEHCGKLFERTGQKHFYCNNTCSKASRDPDTLRYYNAMKQRESRARKKQEQNHE